MSLKELVEKAAGSQTCCPGESCWESGDRPPGIAGSREFGLSLIIRLLVSALVFAAALVIKAIPEPWPLIMLAAAAAVSGYDLLAAAILALIRGDYLNKCVLISFSAILAFAIGAGREGAALILLFQLGSSLIDYAFARTGQNVLDAVSCEAETARILRDGAESDVPAERLVPGNRIVIYPGERVPCDCIVLDGGGSLDTTPLGGGSEPLFIAEGDEILSGCVNLNGTLTCEVTAAQADSAAAALIQAVDAATRGGSSVPSLATRFLELYTPVIVVLAVIVAGILPLVYKIDILQAIRRALVFLVIANPCAMLAALPLISFCTVGKAAKNGILFSDIKTIQNAARTAAVAFDKTGTLTDGTPRVASVKSQRMDADIFIKIAAHALAYSDSPEARAIIASYGGTIYIELIEDFAEFPDLGVEVNIDGVRICVGSQALMAEKAIAIPEADKSDEWAVYLSIAAEYAGRIMLSETLRQDAASGVAELARQGVDSVIMLTGEAASSAAKTASDLNIKEYYSECEREQMLSAITDIRHGLPPRRTMMFVGSKDSAGEAHTAADIDVAVRDVQALNSPFTADLTILNGRVSEIATAIGLAQYAETFAYMTISGVFIIKLAVLVLAALGIATLWFAVFLDLAAALAAILLSIRVLNGDGRGGGFKGLLRR